jgi:hypothetical protein
MARKLALPILLIAGLLSGLLFAQHAKPEKNAKNLTGTFNGTISDTMCGANHMEKDKTAAQCTRECVQAGSDYALVVGEKVYTLKGDAATFDKFAGERVTVKGTMKGDTITAESVWLFGASH